MAATASKVLPLAFFLNIPHAGEMKKEHVKLTDEDREPLKALLAKGSLKARIFKRATGLLELERRFNCWCTKYSVN